MPWYAWLILIVALALPLSSLLLLRDTAKKLPLSPEQLKRIKERNEQQEALDNEQNPPDKEK